MNIDLNDSRIKLCGLPWFEHNGKQLIRLPLELKDQVPEVVWELSKSTAGVRIRFISDTTSLSIDADYQFIDTGVNFSPISRHGLDLYVDGKCWAVVYPYTDKHVEGKYFENIDKKLREYIIYLPNYSEVKINKITFDDDAVILPPSPFALPDPIVFYGSSITQGGCASHPGLSYQGMIERDINLDIVNLGFSGSGKGEASIAKAISSLKTFCFVLDFSQNIDTLEGLEKVYLPFVNELRNFNKNTPILCISPYFSAGEIYNPFYTDRHREFRKLIRSVYNTCIDAGDKNIYIIDGTDLISSDDCDCFVDSIHPNDIGMRKIADGMVIKLKQILSI